VKYYNLPMDIFRYKWISGDLNNWNIMGNIVGIYPALGI
jgi:hypothetical protein